MNIFFISILDTTHMESIEDNKMEDWQEKNSSTFLVCVVTVMSVVCSPYYPEI